MNWWRVQTFDRAFSSFFFFPYHLCVAFNWTTFGLNLGGISISISIFISHDQ